MTARLLMDIQPVRESAAFRRLWAGGALSQIGSQMTAFAVTLQIFTLTRSSVAVGAVGLCAAIPAITLGLVGGTFADTVDRRKLVLITSSALAVVSALFAAQAYAGLDQVWPLYLLLAVQSVLTTVNGPARRTFVPRLLRPEQVPAGAALTMFGAHTAATVGPALAGVLAAAWGLKVCYLIDALSFVAALYGVFRLPAMPPRGNAGRPGARAVLEALAYIRRNRVLLGVFVADLNATVLAMPMALFPAINAAHFGGGARSLGLLTAAVAVGGIVGTTLSGPVGTVQRPGRAVLCCGAVWGIGIAGFGLVTSLWAAFGLLVLAGAADVLSVVFRTSIVQVGTPEEYLGRVSAADYVVGAGCPQLGNFRAGVVASLTTPAISAVSGGLSTVAGAVVIRLALPALVRYRLTSTPAGDSTGDGTEGAVDEHRDQTA